MVEAFFTPGRFGTSKIRGWLGLVLIVNSVLIGGVFADNNSNMEIEKAGPEPIIEHGMVNKAFSPQVKKEASAPFPFPAFLLFGAMAGGAGLYYWILRDRK